MSQATPLTTLAGSYAGARSRTLDSIGRLESDDATSRESRSKKPIRGLSHSRFAC
jgi:hypothetical protein